MASRVIPKSPSAELPLVAAPRGISGLCALASAALALSAGQAYALESKVSVMQEPADVVDVADAFDGDDPFDINVSLGFEFATKEARILRETSRFGRGGATGGVVPPIGVVGDYTETVSRLLPEVEAGLYQDLSAYLRLPIILSRSRKIVAPEGGSTKGILAGAPGEQLFGLPFTSPTRSGVEYLALGVKYTPFNQFRDATKPTWLLGAEAQFTFGDVMRPCNATPATGQVTCAAPGDINRNGVLDPAVDANGATIESADSASGTAGVSRGTMALVFTSTVAKRIKYFEPYGGISGRVEFPVADGPFNDVAHDTTGVTAPPLVGTLTLGVTFHPWENRQAFSRISFDLRFDGEYRSEGRDYSEMFDALGSSAAPSIRQPTWAGFRGACTDGNCSPASVIDPNSSRFFSSGLAVVQAHGTYRTRASVSWRASQYIKLIAGMGVRFDQAHGITHTERCFDAGVATEKGGPCGALHQGRATDPTYREVVNGEGNRFFVDTSYTVEVFARGVVTF